MTGLIRWTGDIPLTDMLERFRLKNEVYPAINCVVSGRTDTSYYY